MVEASMHPLYFTCTLSEALHYNQIHHDVKVNKTQHGLICEHPEFGTITEFVDFLATQYGENLAVGSVTPEKSTKSDSINGNEERLTFTEVREQTCRLGQHFRSHLDHNTPRKRCVALLASSSVIFMLIWLGLIREDYEVLLIAPQNSLSAIKHLLKVSRAFAIYYDVEHEDMVLDALASEKTVQQHSTSVSLETSNSEELIRFKIPWRSLQSLQDCKLDISDNDSISYPRQSGASTAFYFHSSGTTGLPKLIPQTHNGAIGVLPRLQGHNSTNSRISTFTTTPLYHGGIADLFRSWSAASPLWIFPEGKAPIVGHTVLSCIRQINEIECGSEDMPASKLGYLSCVPYVLESLVETPELKEILCRLDAVGVGGAAMPQEFGDKLVVEGIRLVSRFGSSECGFLGSSQRVFDDDILWNTLRFTQKRGLEFVPTQDGRFELIVTDAWQMVSTATHASRPFNTHDVFVRDERIPDGWRYVGRSDSQMTLKTGKKFDPTHIEEDLRRSDLIEDAVLVGDDRPFAAAILFASAKADLKDHKTRNTLIWSHVQEVNKANPPHARLGERSVCILDAKHHSRLRKNNKAAIIRSAFLSEFEEELSSLYSSSKEDDANEADLISPDNIPETLAFIVQDVIGANRNIGPDHDFFDSGIDSTSSIQIRRQICNNLPKHLRSCVPMNIVYECGTLNALSKFIIELLDTGHNTSSENEKFQQTYETMKHMVNYYVSSQPDMLNQALHRAGSAPNQRLSCGKSIILTGSTGFLGIHVLSTLLEDDSISKIFLFVRGSRLVSFDEQQQRAKSRVLSALKFHNLLHIINEKHDSKVEYIPFLLKEPLLGIPSPLYKHLASETTHIIHAAWEVNFNLPLKSFAAQIEGTINLFNILLLSSRHSTNPQKSHHIPSFIFCSSIASIANLQERLADTNEQAISENPEDAANIGYARSKWVTENVLAQLQVQNPEVAVSILRVGQLSASTSTGIWNPREAWPLMLDIGMNAAFCGRHEMREVRHTNGVPGRIMLPDLSTTTLGSIHWLPVDHAAKRIHQRIHASCSVSELQVVKVCNDIDTCSVTWREIQDWIVEWASSREIAVQFVVPDEWLDRLECFAGEHPAKALVSLWRENWLVAQPKNDNRDLNACCIKDSVQNEKVCRRDSTTQDNEDMDSYKLNKDYFWRIVDKIAGC